MKSKKRRIFIYLLIIGILFMAIGFAIFSNALGITGTATTTGTFDIKFISAVPSNTVGCTPTATISADGKTLTITIPDLAYPGAGSDIGVTVKNLGNISAILRTVTTLGIDDPDISVVINNPPINDIMASNEERVFTITVKWNPVSTTGSKNITFTANLVYEQYIP
jgi:hypothetical protein